MTTLALPNGFARWAFGLSRAPSVAGHIRAVVQIPIRHAGDIADIAIARHAWSGSRLDHVGMTTQRLVDHVVIEHGVVPMDGQYYDLTPHS